MAIRPCMYEVMSVLGTPTPGSSGTWGRDRRRTMERYTRGSGSPVCQTQVGYAASLP